MKIYLPAPKKEEELIVGDFDDPNMMRSEEDMRRNGGRYFDMALEGLGMQKPDKPLKFVEPRVLTYRPAPIIEAASKPF